MSPTDPSGVTIDLSRRPARTPDHLAESRVLAALARALSASPDEVLQAIAGFAT